MEQPNRNDKRQDALIALLLARAASVASGGAGVFESLWTPVAAGAVVAVAANGLYEGDSTGAVITYDLPSNPPAGTTVGFKFVGATFPNPSLFNAGAGDRVELPQTNGTFSAIAGQVTIGIPGFVWFLKFDGAARRWVEFIPGPSALMGRTISTATALFIDPQNSSTLANDSNSGADAAHPILTMAEFNRRVFLTNFTAPTVTFTFMSDIVPGTTVDLSTTLANAVTFQGTPVVTGGAVSTLTTVTDIVPATQTVESLTDVARGSFAGHRGEWVRITAGPRAGNSAIIMDLTVPAAPRLSRPMTAANGVGAALLQAGDSYQIQRGSNIGFVPSFLGLSGQLTLIDLSINQAGALDDQRFNALAVSATRCSWAQTLIFDDTISGFTVNNSFTVWRPFSKSTAGLTFNGGGCTSAFSCLQLNLQNDVWLGTVLDVGTADGVVRCYISSGAQFHSFGRTAIELNVGGNLLITSLIWGNDTVGYGIRIHAGATLHTLAGHDPIVTGTLGDFTFVSGGVDSPTGNTVSQAGVVGVAAATTWANYTNAAVFDRNCHRVDQNAGIMLDSR